jgi:hypothetical protein
MQPVFELLQGGDPEAICAKYGITRAALDKRLKSYHASQRQMGLQDELSFAKVGRNDPCPCGSGKKYKKCCLLKHEEARKNVPPDQLQEMEEQARIKEKLEKDIERGFDLLFSQDYGKAKSLALNLLENFPEDDRLHDISVMVALAIGDYDSAFHQCRRRWQVAQEEKAFFKENNYHKREAQEPKKPVHFYSPSTWLDKLWVAQKARDYHQLYPQQPDSPLEKIASRLKQANDSTRFPGRQEEGLQARRLALAPVIDQLAQEGPAAIPYLLPLTYTISWASLFVPDLLRTYGTDDCIRLLCELSMFRFPFFSQTCLVNLESFADRAVEQIRALLEEKPAFDELKVGMIDVLGNIRTPASFEILVKLTDHESPYVVYWVSQALARHQNPEALPYLERIEARLEAHGKIAGAIEGLANQQNQ